MKMMNQTDVEKTGDTQNSGGDLGSCPDVEYIGTTIIEA